MGSSEGGQAGHRDVAEIKHCMLQVTIGPLAVLSTLCFLAGCTQSKPVRVAYSSWADNEIKLCTQHIYALDLGPSMAKSAPYTVLICDTDQGLKWNDEKGSDWKNAITLDAKEFPVRFLKDKPGTDRVYKCQKTSAGFDCQ
jgi:hypothetical protein